LIFNLKLISSPIISED